MLNKNSNDLLFDTRDSLEKYAQLGYIALPTKAMAKELRRSVTLQKGTIPVMNQLSLDFLVGSEQYPFEIYYVEDLYIMSGMMKRLDFKTTPYYFKLMRDLDFRCPESYYDYKNSHHFFWEKRDWDFCIEANKEVIERPISLEATTQCCFDGNYHVLSGFTTIPDFEKNTSGIFGICKNVCITNLTVYDAIIYGENSILAQSIENVNISNCQLCHCAFLSVDPKIGALVGIVASDSKGDCQINQAVVADLEIPEHYGVRMVANPQKELSTLHCFQFKKDQIKKWYIKK